MLNTLTNQNVSISETETSPSHKYTLDKRGGSYNNSNKECYIIYKTIMNMSLFHSKQKSKFSQRLIMPPLDSHQQVKIKMHRKSRPQMWHYVVVGRFN